MLKHRPHICNVRRPLLAVSNLNDNGWDVFFTLEGAWMENRKTNQIVSYVRLGGRFELIGEVVQLSGGTRQASL